MQARRVPTQHASIVTPVTGVLLLDASSLYFRAFYGVPERPSNPQTPPTNAIRGFLDMISSLITRYTPEGLVVCWDEDWRPAFRVNALPSYKAQRVRITTEGIHEEDAPHDLTIQVPIIIQALRALGIPRIGASGYEADDVIATLAHRWATTPEHPIHVVTGDRDLFQLVDDTKGIDVLYTARTGVRAPELVNETYLHTTYGIRGGRGYLDFATLRGDPSDGLPGVRGIGEKTARTLLEKHGSLAALRAAATDPNSELTATQRTRITNASDYLDAAATVVATATDAPIGDVNPALPRHVADLRLLSDLAARYRLANTFDRLLAACAIA
ncbi:5'-3' exonuclease [Dermatophilus congolensis]|nr:5'-3' exonuclease [Dermatophilus congolensis]MBO3129410.1 5'-3' exonuclease [Dermatophilus congolensis]MBO3131957.1 5'-3' exonuclease [Dermatophilus congolensis]MBO3133887.1 5'-3' exonuclease [Dermatophilus congolensis]MBO3136117.1 5'-3' exonuclease [Dermatophilus congolensis]MBO3138361.1 5'-3' exonuclease [Dermatophilus congolensis]